MYSSSQGCHTATGTHMPHGITQCYLPPGRGDIPIVRGKRLCNGRVSVCPSVCHSRKSTAAATCCWFVSFWPSIALCRLPQPGRGQQISIDSWRRQSCGRRRCCDPRRIDADWSCMHIQVHTPVSRPVVRDYPGKPVPER